MRLDNIGAAKRPDLPTIKLRYLAGANGRSSRVQDTWLPKFD